MSNHRCCIFKLAHNYINFAALLSVVVAKLSSIVRLVGMWVFF